MDKIQLLKALDESGTANVLSGDEIKLYILLLAHCGRTGEGTIKCAAIREALGEEFSPDSLKESLLCLEEHGLVEITSQFPNIAARRHFTLSYQVYPAKGAEKDGNE